MAITTYSELQTAIASRLHRDDLTAEIPDFITFAEARLNRELRITGMISVDATSSFVAGTKAYAVPSDFLSAKSVQVNGDPVRLLEQTTPDIANAQYPESATSKPYLFSRIGGSLYYYPTPDSTYTYQLTYYAKPTALSDSNTSNFYLTDVPDLLLYAALIYGADHVEDEGKLNKYVAVYDRLKQEIMDADKQDSWGASNQRTRVK